MREGTIIAAAVDDAAKPTAEELDEFNNFSSNEFFSKF
jgi:hypothetical protein